MYTGLVLLHRPSHICIHRPFCSHDTSDKCHILLFKHFQLAQCLFVPQFLTELFVSKLRWWYQQLDGIMLMHMLYIWFFFTTEPCFKFCIVSFVFDIVDNESAMNIFLEIDFFNQLSPSMCQKNGLLTRIRENPKCNAEYSKMDTLIYCSYSRCIDISVWWNFWLLLWSQHWTILWC
jgi:hypothetical protein